MRKAMAEAKVGDDVLGDDPTVKRLEEMAANLVGKESSLFFPSGTMANATAVKVWTREGDAVVVEEKSHIYNLESAHLSMISRVLPKPIPSDRGTMDPAVVQRLLGRKNIHIPPVSLVSIENTHNYYGGAVVPLSNFSQLRDVAHDHGLKIHLDGARIFNAEAASGVPAAEYATFCDSIMFCLSKGLGAPIGSMLAGPEDFIGEARRIRKLLGGGMRQVGVIAAAGMVALSTMRDRLAEDHKRARRLWEGLGEIGAIEISPEPVETNMVVACLNHPKMTAMDFAMKAAERGLMVLSTGQNRLRFVTHKDLADRDVERAIDIAAEILR
jgi:threonine aldolase